MQTLSSTEVTFAGFWVRLAAFIIDSCVVAIGLLAVRLFLSGVMFVLDGTPLAGNLLFSYNLKDIVLYIFGALYYILCTYCTGTTLGKRVMNLRVINAGEEEKLAFFNVVYRETVGKFLSSFIIILGALIIALDKEKRGFHDMLSDTRVIYAKKVKTCPVPLDTRRQLPPRPQPPQQFRVETDPDKLEQVDQRSFYDGPVQ